MHTVFTQIVAQGYYYFLPKNKDKTLQIVPHCDIIRGCAIIKFYTHMHTANILNITFLLTINGNSYNSFNCLQHCNTWESYIQGYMNARYRWHGHSELWVKDGDNHDTFAVVVIMTEYIIGHILKAITYYYLLLKNVHAALFEGVLQLKWITKIRLFVLE